MSLAMSSTQHPAACASRAGMLRFGVAGELDIDEAARLLIYLLGAEAEAAALKHCERLRDQGDLAGVAMWRQISTAVVDLQRGQRVGEVVN